MWNARIHWNERTFTKLMFVLIDVRFCRFPQFLQSLCLESVFESMASVFASEDVNVRSRR